MKGTLAYVPASAFIALFGVIDSGKAANIFQTDEFSGKITLNTPMVMPAGPPLLTKDLTLCDPPEVLENA